jgi:hypothetical protein
MLGLFGNVLLGRLVELDAALQWSRYGVVCEVLIHWKWQSVLCSLSCWQEILEPGIRCFEEVVSEASIP